MAFRRRRAPCDINPESDPPLEDLPAPRYSRREPMPGPFNALAQYNSERARGLVHTAAYDARMAALQAEFDRWASEVRLP
jgi:hypothetical protein